MRGTLGWELLSFKVMRCVCVCSALVASSFCLPSPSCLRLRWRSMQQPAAVVLASQPKRLPCSCSSRASSCSFPPPRSWSCMWAAGRGLVPRNEKKIACRRAAKSPPCSPSSDLRHVDAQAIRRLLLAQLQRGALGSHYSTRPQGSAYMQMKDNRYASAPGLQSRGIEVPPLPDLRSSCASLVPS